MPLTAVPRMATLECLKKRASPHKSPGQLSNITTEINKLKCGGFEFHSGSSGTCGWGFPVAQLVAIFTAMVLNHYNKVSQDKRHKLSGTVIRQVVKKKKKK